MKPLPTKKFCTCEGPFGCELHDPKVETIRDLSTIPTAVVMAVIQRANDVHGQLQNANGEVYVIDCEVAHLLGDALRALAIEGAKVRA